MARFYGRVKGGRGEAHRCGDAKNGLWVKAQTWSGYVQVELFVDRKTEEDWALVFIVDRHGDSRTLYRGPVADYRDPRGKRVPMIQPQELAALTTQETDSE